MKASHINLAATASHCRATAIAILDAQQRADDAGARVIEHCPAAAQEIASAVLLDSQGSDGGLCHVHRAAHIAGVPQSAGITAYHRVLAAEHVARLQPSLLKATFNDARIAAAAADAAADIAADDAAAAAEYADAVEALDAAGAAEIGRAHV